MVLPENFVEDIGFGKAVMFGYRTDEVDDFVTKAVEIIKGQQEEMEVLLDKMALLAATVEKYREDEDSLRAALIGAQKLGDSILKDSKSKAEIILRDATTQASYLLDEAHGRVQKEQADYDRLRVEVSSFRERLIAMYRTHVDQITRIPHLPEQAQEVPAEAETPAEPVAATEEQFPESAAPVAAEPVTLILADEQGEQPEQTIGQELPEPEEGTEESPGGSASDGESVSVSAAVQLEWNDLIAEYGGDREEDGDEGDFESKVDRIISRGAGSSDSAAPLDAQMDFDDVQRGRPVISPKFGVLKFGDDFDFREEDPPVKIKKEKL